MIARQITKLPSSEASTNQLEAGSRGPRFRKQQWSRSIASDLCARGASGDFHTSGFRSRGFVRAEWSRPNGVADRGARLFSTPALAKAVLEFNSTF